jgi:hypothetical protein
MNEQYQRLRFGGFNAGAAFFGWLVAVAVAALLTTLISAAGGAVALTQGLSSINQLTGDIKTVGLASAIALLVALAVAYYAGGYVAGRMSRFDGSRQGFGVWALGFIVTVVLALAGALLGSSFNLLQQLNLPHIPVNQGAFTTGGLATLLVGLVVTLLAAIAGGKAGEAYHRRIDAAGRDADQFSAVERDSAQPRPAQAQDARRYGREPEMSFGERIERRHDR